MVLDKYINLVATVKSKNTIGDTTETVTKTGVCASEESIRQSEFYQSMSTGLRPEIMFVIWNCEYSGQTKLEYNSKIYQIIRTYNNKKDPRFLELICNGVVGNR